MSDPKLTPAHRDYLAAHAVDPELAESLGVRSLTGHPDVATLGEPWQNWANFPAIAFPWTGPDGRTEWQVRPDNPTKDRSGRAMKYVFRKGMTPVLWAVRPVETAERVLIVEGTKQCLAAATYAPPEVAVYGIAGCHMWSSGGSPIPDLAVAEGRRVVVILDADAATNPQVYAAGEKLAEALLQEGATEVLFTRMVGGGDKDGLDDVLAARAPEKRAGWLARLIKAAKAKPAKARPKRKEQKAPAGREVLDVTNVADAADWLRQHIGTGSLAGYFNRDDRLVYLPAEGEDGYVKLTANELDNDGPVQVRSAGPENVSARISLDFWCFIDDVAGGKRHALFPGEAARTIANAVDKLPNLRRLRGVTHTPLVRRDGSILDTPGYDEPTGLYFLPLPGLEVPKVPESPTRDQVRAAVALLDEVVWDFPFRTPDHRANFLGLMITPVLRQLIPPPYKLGVFDAPMSRSGKTLMTDLIRAVHGGVFRTEVPEDNEEWVKTISAILNVTTGPVVTFDNVSGKLQSSALDGLLSSRTFQARQLGSTKDMVDRVNDRLWTITSNNANLAGDLIPRSIWVSINPGQPNPEDRVGFRHDNILTWTEEHRGELLAAMLTLVRAWVVAGRPGPTVPVASDKWDGWVSAVRSILEHAGIPGTFDARESRRQTITEENKEWAGFLEAIHEVFGDKEFTAAEVLERVGKFPGDQAEIDPDKLPGDLGTRHTRGDNVSKSLGRWLTNHAERWAGGRMVRQAREHRGTKVWVVCGFAGLEGFSPPKSRGKLTISELGPRENMYSGGETGGGKTLQTRKPSPQASVSSSIPAPRRPATLSASCPRAGDPNHKPGLCAVCVMAARLGDNQPTHPTCGCGERLLHPRSIESGTCERCRLRHTEQTIKEITA